ncbi:hypothetical protein C5167_012354 [Papaver somniferum]|uniref:Polysaccharide biosynthesis protein C-terminal domain-containing protein n=1 Tax=Papaver somniferum TaxID=3469 RepID=A0A4Y7J094_PAPSO|nr:hypothetical protein C5167_012354 [Papaver somniferum]
MMISSAMTALLHFVVFLGSGLGLVFSKEVLHDILNFIRLAVPSAIMQLSNFINWNSLEVWSFELVVLLSGLLPNPKLETSMISISTQVSNELGADHPQAARLAVQVVFVLASTQGILIGTIMILVRHIWGSAYSNEKEVVHYVVVMMPILAISNFVYGLQYVRLEDVVGQKIGAYVNLGSYYLVGIPCAVLLAFVLHVGGMLCEALGETRRLGRHA